MRAAADFSVSGAEMSSASQYADHGKRSWSTPAAFVACMALVAQTFCACSSLPSAAISAAPYANLNEPPPSRDPSADEEAARTKAELHSKQFDISREMMKFQMDVRLEIGVMERRLNNFEMKVMDEVQAEIRALARSYEDLNRKTTALITKLSSNDLHEFIECQRRKTEEIQKEVDYLKAQDDKLKIQSCGKNTGRRSLLFGSFNAGSRINITYCTLHSITTMHVIFSGMTSSPAEVRLKNNLVLTRKRL